MAKLSTTLSLDPPCGAVVFDAVGNAKKERDGSVRLHLKQGKWGLSVSLPPKRSGKRPYKVPRKQFPATVHAWLKGEHGETLAFDGGWWGVGIDLPLSEVEGDLAALKREIARSEDFAAEYCTLGDRHAEEMDALYARHGVER